jgi:dihydropyrimidinase
VYDWLIKGGTVVSGSGSRIADVGIVADRIVEVAPSLSRGDATSVVDAGGRLVLPGLIDSHNHPYYYDDLESFSYAAAHGGVTTLMSFAGRPLNSPVTDVIDMVDEFIRDGEQRSYLDFGLHVILTPADDPLDVLAPLLDRGVTSFKIFFAFHRQKRMFADDMALGLMQAIARVGGLCMVHCENGLAIELLEDQMRSAGRVSVSDYVASRPPQLEGEAVYRALSLAEVAGCDCYVVHVSTAESVDIVRQFRQRGGPARYAETCPHYLLLEDHDQIRIGGRAKISPPMRTATDRDGLWQGVLDDGIDIVASDCSGQTCVAKHHGEPNIFDVASGIPGVEQFFPLIFNEGVHRRSVPVEMLVKRVCERPAEIFDLPRKGRIAVGMDADVAIFDPAQEWTVRAADQHGNSDYSLYEGSRVRGRALWTMQRGRVVLDDGAVVGPAGGGRYIPRSVRGDASTSSN